MADRQSYARTTAVAVCSLLLFGVVSYLVVVFGAIAVLPLLLAPTPLADAAGLLAHLLAIGVAVKISLEAARVWLHGLSELQRGSPRRRLARHALLTVPVLAVLLLLFATVVELATFVATDGFDSPAVVVLAGAGLLAAAVVVRTALAFRDGRREAREAREASRVAERVFGRFRK